MGRRTAVILIVVPLLAALSSLGVAKAEEGRQLYLRYCASCHGPQGLGDGPDAEVFTAKPRNLHEAALSGYATDDLVRRVQEGKPLELELDPAAIKERYGEIRALETHIKRLPTIDWETLAKGWNLYADRCQICHGPYGHPESMRPAGVRLPRDLSDPAFQRSLQEGELITVVRHGRRGMPALTPRVSETDAKPLAEFVRFLSPGFALYSRYCANCHGDQGLGSNSPPGSVGLPSMRFDQEYLGQTDPKQLDVKVWHMIGEQKASMPHFRWTISPSDAQKIVEYLKQPVTPQDQNGKTREK